MSQNVQNVSFCFRQPLSLAKYWVKLSTVTGHTAPTHQWHLSTWTVCERWSFHDLDYLKTTIRCNKLFSCCLLLCAVFLFFPGQIRWDHQSWSSSWRVSVVGSVAALERWGRFNTTWTRLPTCKNVSPAHASTRVTFTAWTQKPSQHRPACTCGCNHFPSNSTRLCTGAKSHFADSSMSYGLCAGSPLSPY